jgi:orotate phosphoribosyltransferase-like protein
MSEPNAATKKKRKTVDEDQKPATSKKLWSANNKTVIMVDGSVSTNQLNRDVGTGHTTVAATKERKSFEYDQKPAASKKLWSADKKTVITVDDSASTNQPNHDVGTGHAAVAATKERKTFRIQYPAVLEAHNGDGDFNLYLE